MSTYRLRIYDVEKPVQRTGPLPLPPAPPPRAPVDVCAMSIDARDHDDAQDVARTKIAAMGRVTRSLSWSPLADEPHGIVLIAYTLEDPKKRELGR